MEKIKIKVLKMLIFLMQKLWLDLVKLANQSIFQKTIKIKIKNLEQKVLSSVGLKLVDQRLVELETLIRF